MENKSTKATFTKEHLDELQKLATEFLFGNIVLKGVFGSGELSIHNLLHTCSKETLVRYKEMFAADVAKSQLTLTTDEFIMTADELRTFKKSLTDKEKSLRLLQLIIAYKNNLSLKEKQKKSLREKRKDYQAAVEATKTPAQKLLELQEEIKSLELEINSDD